MSRPWPPPVSIAILLAIVSLLAEARLQIGSAQPGIPIPLSPNLAGVTFPAGWNLVSNPGNPDPGGNILTGTDGPVYCYPVRGAAYEVVASGFPMQGEACWAYFDGPTTESLDAGLIRIPHRLQVPPRQWVLIGNPTSTTRAHVVGATAVVVYNPLSGTYEATTTLEPGEGAWVYSEVGGSVAVIA